MGFDHYFVGPELEYFYFRDSKSTEVLVRAATSTSRARRRL